MPDLAGFYFKSDSLTKPDVYWLRNRLISWITCGLPHAENLSCH